MTLHKEITEEEFDAFISNMDYLREEMAKLDREKSIRPKQIKKARSTLNKLEYKKKHLQRAFVNEYAIKHKQNLFGEIEYSYTLWRTEIDKKSPGPI